MRHLKVLLLLALIGFVVAQNPVQDATRSILSPIFAVLDVLESVAKIIASVKTPTSDGRNLGDILLTAIKVIRNSLEYWAINGGKFTEPIGELVTISCGNRNNPLTPVDVTSIASVTDISQTYALVTHGWVSNGSMWWTDPMVKGLLDNFPDINVCVIDWRKIAEQDPFTISSAGLFVVADYLVKFFKAVNARWNINNLQYTCIGHSMGGEMCGVFGTNMGRISEIYPLDPVGVSYQGHYKTYLTEAAAIYTQTLVCNNVLFGKLLYTAKGSQVMYCNLGGPFQPGCLVDPLCSHSRCIEIFIESLNPLRVFGARQCKDVISYVFGLCDDNYCDRVGPWGTRQSSGPHFVNTNSKSPFSQGTCRKRNVLENLILVILNLIVFGDINSPNGI